MINQNIVREEGCAVVKKYFSELLTELWKSPLLPKPNSKNKNTLDSILENSNLNAVHLQA